MSNTVYLDITTIGYGDKKQIIEVTVLDNEGFGEESVLFHTLVRPSHEVSPHSLSTLKINPEHLAQAPDFATVYGHLVSKLSDKFVVVFNWNETFDALIDKACENGLKVIFFNGSDIENKTSIKHKWNNDNLGINIVQPTIEFLFEKCLNNIISVDKDLLHSSISIKYCLMTKYIYKNL